MRQRNATYTTLKVVGGQGAAIPTTRIPSQSQQASQAALAYVVREWATIGDVNQQMWNTAAGTWAAQFGLPPDGFSAYKSLGLTRLIMGQDVSVIPPTLPDPIPGVPEFDVEATLSSAGVFTLRILSAAATGPFLIAATGAQTRGTSRFHANDYRILEVDEVLTSTGTTLSLPYSSIFLTPPLESKVSVQITALTRSGFRGSPRYNYAIVVPPPALEVTG